MGGGSARLDCAKREGDDPQSRIKGLSGTRRLLARQSETVAQRHASGLIRAVRSGAASAMRRTAKHVKRCDDHGTPAFRPPPAPLGPGDSPGLDLEYRWRQPRGQHASEWSRARTLGSRCWCFLLCAGGAKAPRRALYSHLRGERLLSCVFRRGVSLPRSFTRCLESALDCFTRNYRGNWR